MKNSFELQVTQACLYVPVHIGGMEQVVSFYQMEEGRQEKIMEFVIPVDKTAESGMYPADYYAELPVRTWMGKRIRVEADAPVSFFETFAQEPPEPAKDKARPQVHFAAETGWINDPNGLFFKDGVYHLYFQFNPMDINWNNMSWGHAVSPDLLHWTQRPLVMVPDEQGTCYSGSAILNDRGIFPGSKEDVLYFFTCAGSKSSWSEGRTFTQRLAVSTDGGMTLRKEREPVIPHLVGSNRDPKVFWHEESQSYVMVLWLEGHDYGIFRSSDLCTWEMTQRLSIGEEWECPDLFRVKIRGTETSCWIFWTADGHYLTGHFDGFRFEQEGELKTAYRTALPYAAQTFSGIGDRVVMIPWLRVPNDGRRMTGMMGIPCELEAAKVDGEICLCMRPVRELFEQMERVPKETSCHAADGPLWLDVDSLERDFELLLKGTKVTYSAEDRVITAGETSASLAPGARKLGILVDDCLMEAFTESGRDYAAFVLSSCEGECRIEAGQVTVSRIPSKAQ